jgi:bifunctional non-homologous end joining protein LigD
MPAAKRSLAPYRAKRNFKKSPEPTGSKKIKPATPQNSKGRFFCVQKHLASHLHYDFRLEHKGVLLSWAVPKGPSLNPKDKRLAMQVEDHPLDYGDFEGVIPEGYGAGIVMLWDRGTWQPESTDIDRGLEKGELKFSLNGTKLKGSWVLVRTRAASSTSKPAWLLIKHRDDWSGEIDVTEKFPDSVKSFKDFPHILADDTPAVWKSHKPASGGSTGKLLQEIIDQAAALKSSKPTAKPKSKSSPAPHRTATS